MRRFATRALALAGMLWSPAALAQTTDTPAASSAQLLPRTEFRLSAEHLSRANPGFVWDANFGAELDVIDYVHGRSTFVANYQVIMGNEFRRFDPNQGNYILAGSTSVRIHGLELSAVFYHQSRHLSDRAKRRPVDWNMVGGRIEKAVANGPVHLLVRSDIRGVVQKSFVDYRWEVDSRLRTLYDLSPHVALLSDLNLRLLGVNGSQNRGRQTGFRSEGGIRFAGARGAMEFYGAAERRIDPDPLSFGTDTWFAAGFRLLSR